MTEIEILKENKSICKVYCDKDNLKKFKLVFDILSKYCYHFAKIKFSIRTKQSELDVSQLFKINQK